VSLFDRRARLFREPATTDETAASGELSDGPQERGRRGDPGGGDEPPASPDGSGDDTSAGSDDRPAPNGTRAGAVAVVVQAPPEGVRRYELTLRGDVPIAGVEPELLTSLFESFDEGSGVVRSRAVDVDGRGRAVDGAAPLFVVRFAEPVDPETVSLDGSIDGHDEEPVPWSRIRLTPVE
jgi:hypothetical protein